LYYSGFANLDLTLKPLKTLNDKNGWLRGEVKVLKLAIETQRWDLAAHVLIFATLQVKDGPNRVSDSARRRENDAKKEKRRPQGQPERS
jgi:hypothetical protein